ncbi:stage III sporulation protein AF [Bacillus sp. FJAT-27264]|uniref:stage III sporulation protein AF n=1 Tax=Paenibacillus sp. (strain DSM 101736 / FJAT-27264) TaxID=1850362 RepID=UPI000807D443|nr:stage III sporulation protein AF [Bacillus sp. FJAT-27264]OBZ18944.1 stage III sporulation protein AF [Bacillus sp. FJAT-27264]
MTWLSDWLREIILVVLLAAFVELLLPSKSMERYARLVLSLLILLTLLNPVVSLLKGDAAKELSLAMNQQEKTGGLFTSADKGTDSLEKILSDGQKLAQGRQEQSLKLAAEEVAGQMRDQITSQTGVRGVRVTVSLAMGKPPGGSGGEEVPMISGVTVALPAAQSPSGAEEGASGAAVSQPIVIAPVEAVEVSIGGTSSAAPAQTGHSGAKGRAGETGESSKEANSITELLKQKWDLNPEIIHIQDQSAIDEKM